MKRNCIISKTKKRKLVFICMKLKIKILLLTILLNIFGVKVVKRSIWFIGSSFIVKIKLKLKVETF